MKVVFCSVPIMDFIGDMLVPIGQDLPPHAPTLAIYGLAAYLRECNYEIAVIDLVAAGTNRLDKFLPALRDANLIAISSTSLNWATVLNVFHRIRGAEITVPIVVGGVHPTMFADYLLNAVPHLDFIIRHEGEKALLALCRALEGNHDYSEVPNLSWRAQDGKIIHNASMLPLTVEELASLPVPAYDLLPTGIFPALSVQSSRGCPFNCSFCSTSYRRSYRGIPPAAFVDTLEGVLALGASRVLDPNLIQIVDDEWSIDRKRSIAILQEIDRRGLAIKFTFDSRANDFLINEEYTNRVAPYTARFLVGAECGYDEGLLKIGKGTTVERLNACARLLAKYNIAQHAEFSFILGLPWEGKEEVLKTVRFASHLVLEYGVNVLLQWYCQIPGSELWDESWRRGEVTPAMYDKFGFFRDLYLFKTGVKLSPDDIGEVMDVIQTTHSLIALVGRSKKTMLYSPPAAIEINFPKTFLKANESSTGALIWNTQARERASGGLRV
jgi:radical SAM superfamily enzyme YgiQ (UPF0313 family)